ncbi:triose-phosphate isomerase, partial [Salmonella enterica subsp. enterica serovar Chester]|nr:triose-phosphate isomerase [Salmonella enterica subsp. enterica serovar Chester]
MRHPLVMGNWKLNGSSKMVYELITALRHEIGNVTGCDVAIAPPAI